MPKPTTSAPDGDSRKALQDRAREAARPATPATQGRWPFPVGSAMTEPSRDDRREAASPDAIE